MRKIWIALIIIVVLLGVACGGKQPATAPGQTTPGTAPGAENAVQKPTTLKAVNQDDPKAALLSFFEVVNIALDPEYQVADKDPNQDKEKARLYQEAMKNLKSLFVSGAAQTEICAYLDLIKIKGAEIVGEPTVNGEKAKAKVRVVKGKNLEIDPMAFGESDPNEAKVEVLLEKKNNKWLIADFGGLAAKALAKKY